jgi:hypothetical protein
VWDRHPLLQLLQVALPSTTKQPYSGLRCDPLLLLLLLSPAGAHQGVQVPGVCCWGGLARDGDGRGDGSGAGGPGG